MYEEEIRKIKDLLNKIILFDEEYKNNILAKAAKLDEAGLSKIKNLLFEVESWQKAIIEEKLKKDPHALDRLAELTQDKNKLIFKANSAIIAARDQEKISRVLTMIEKL